jgi:hypothetical protein
MIGLVVERRLLGEQEAADMMSAQARVFRFRRFVCLQ